MACVRGALTLSWRKLLRWSTPLCCRALPLCCRAPPLSCRARRCERSRHARASLLRPPFRRPCPAAAARAVEGLTHDGVILSVRRVEIAGARTLEMSGEKGGSLPIILVSSQVQYIHTVRNKKVSEGGRAAGARARGEVPVRAEGVCVCARPCAWSRVWDGCRTFEGGWRCAAVAQCRRRGRVPAVQKSCARWTDAGAAGATSPAAAAACAGVAGGPVRCPPAECACPQCEYGARVPQCACTKDVGPCGCAGASPEDGVGRRRRDARTACSSAVGREDADAQASDGGRVFFSRPHSTARPHAAPHAPRRPRPQGEIVEGSESEVRAAQFVVAVTREYDAATGRLEWKVVELAMQGAQLYL